MSRPEVSLIVSTYAMPDHLRRVLASAARQTAIDRLEILVTDDGSTDATSDVVANFSRSFGRPVTYLTHPHAGFHLTKCRNDAARIAKAPYLLFLDGDCLIPRDHVEQFLRHRRRGTVHFGYCCRMPEEISGCIQEPEIESGAFEQAAPRSELWKLAKLHWKSKFYGWMRHRTKPALKGGNIGVWREDFERVNGFDENFRAWGCEDDDLSYRVRAAGLTVASILGSTRTYHLWHPPATTKPSQRWSTGANVAYLKRPGRLTACMNGLRKRTIFDLRTRIVGGELPNDCHPSWRLLVANQVDTDDACELEIRIDAQGRIPHRPADCRVLVTRDVQSISPRLISSVDYTASYRLDAESQLAPLLGGETTTSPFAKAA